MGLVRGRAEEIRVLRDGTPMSVSFSRYNGHRLECVCGEAPKFQDKISALVGNCVQRSFRSIGYDRLRDFPAFTIRA